MTVYLAWYHNGFIDDYPKLLGVYASRALAEAGVQNHKAGRDRDEEYRDRASWNITEEVMIGSEL